MIEPVLVQCPNCDAQLRIKNPALIGKRAPCPKCGERFVLEAAEQDDPPEDEFDFGASSDDYGEPEDEYEEPVHKPKASSSGSGKSPKGKKKRKKKSTDIATPLMLGGGVLAGLAVVAGLIYGIMSLVKGGGFGGSPPDMAWLPNNTEMLIQVRVADVTSSAVVSKILAEPAIAAALQEGTAKFGFGLADIERVSMGFPNFESLQNAGGGPPSDFCLVISLKNPVDPAATVEKVKSLRQEPLESKDYNGRTLYIGGPADQLAATCFIDNKTVLVGPETSVRQAIDGGGVCQAASKFQWADSTNDVMFVVVPQDKTMFDRSGMSLQRTGPFGGGGPAGRASDEIEGMFGAVNFGSDVEVSYGIKSRSSSTARASVATMEKELRDAAEALALQRQQAGGGFNPMTMMLGPAADGIMGKVETALRNADGSSSGSVCKVSITLPGGIVDDAKSLITMAAAGMSGGLPGGPSGFPMPAEAPPGGPTDYAPPGFPGAPDSGGAFPPGFPGSPGAPGVTPPSGGHGGPGGGHGSP